MIEFLRNWIISVVSTVIFMVLVDLVLPSNSLKKYAKFVTGLIVIITILTPIFKLFDRNSSIQTYINQYSATYNSSSMKINNEEIQKRIQDQTIEVFKANLRKKIQQEINSETGKGYEVNNIEIEEDVNSLDFAQIKYIELKEAGDDKDIKPVDKIEVHKNSQIKSEFKDEKVITFLKDKFNINPNTVKFVK
jgi:stage III sporulation protein AF